MAKKSSWKRHFTQVTPFTKVLALALYFVIAFGAFTLGQWYERSKNETIPQPPYQKACTMEAKICPDGTAVGRSGPNCEFVPCPN